MVFEVLRERYGVRHDGGELHVVYHIRADVGDESLSDCFLGGPIDGGGEASECGGVGVTSLLSDIAM